MDLIPKAIARLFSTADVAALQHFREKVHRYPELSNHEKETQKTIRSALEQLNPTEIASIANTGIIARFKGYESSAPTTIIRGDMDALPITEETGVKYTSCNHGIMHACGHDVHMAWTLGVGHLLTHHPSPGDVILLFQPAEEQSVGAPRIIESGGLKGTDRIFAAHVDRRYAIPSVVCQSGPVSAASDHFQIIIEGRSAHGARPEEGIDPTPILAEMIQRLHMCQNTLSTPNSRVIVSIGTINGGSSHNIIPASLVITGTIRTQFPDKRQSVHDHFNAMVTELSMAGPSKVTYDISKGSPSIINDTDIVRSVSNKLSKTISSDFIRTLDKPNMASEDFAYYLTEIPGCYFRIGARYKNDPFIPVHNSYFIAESEAILMGSWVLWSCCNMDSLNPNT